MILTATTMQRSVLGFSKAGEVSGVDGRFYQGLQRAVIKNPWKKVSDSERFVNKVPP